MAVYAAQISNVDRGVGRMLEVLRKSGADKNTLVLFLSDNGAASNGGLAPTEDGFGFAPGADNSNWRKDSVAIKPGSGPDLMPGPHDTFAGYGIAWATMSMSNTPLAEPQAIGIRGWHSHTADCPLARRHQEKWRINSATWSRHRHHGNVP